MAKTSDKIGGKITLKSIGKKIESGAKKIFNKSTGKKIASTLIHQGIPAVTSALGGIGAEFLAPELGPVSAFAGSQLGDAAGKRIATLVGNKTGLGLIHHLHHHIVSSARSLGNDISSIGKDITEHNIIYPILHLAHNGLHKTKLGKGFFDKVKKVAGIAWKHLAPVAKQAGREAAKIGAEALGAAVTEYTGNPDFGRASSALANELANEAIDSIKEPKKTSIKQQKVDTKRVVNDALQLSKDEVREPSPKVKAPLSEPTHKKAGLGIRQRGHHQHHISGGMVGYGHTDALESQITYVGGNNDYNTPVQLGSPYQYTYSPAMHPYFDDCNQLQGYNPIEAGHYGGSFMPAGTQGGSVVIHHIHHSTIGTIARKRRGGSFMAAGGD